MLKSLEHIREGSLLGSIGKGMMGLYLESPPYGSCPDREMPVDICTMAIGDICCTR